MLSAPWFTIWAYIFYIIVIFGIVLRIFRVLQNDQELKHDIEFEKLKRDQEEILHEHKLMFFTDIAHEFKTPLSLIVGPVNSLICKVLNEEDQKFCYSVLSRNVNRMTYLVNQFLDFRKILSKKFFLTYCRMHLRIPRKMGLLRSS